MTTKNVVLYLRKGLASHELIDPSFDQRTELQLYCSQNNLTVLAEFCDSGNKGQCSNKGLLRMIIFLKRNNENVSAVIVHDSIQLSGDIRIRNLFYQWIRSTHLTLLKLHSSVEDYTVNFKMHR